ncbi:hypothetical protein [Tessaracoccus antarcticus]|uniref:Copper chaperone PCu(A)C n=1 Tax=Tessaracoccus antarcticus TaxID=2479848 RepID=A0A3M0GLL2_9ACTN|nr:hypothetical protein [Tessaracoccus antarcticus]RMB62059.1 hypothetical protein EAX62_05610 [Tessaracoccus antarcticus]
MTLPIRRRVGTCLAALALVVGLSTGCTAGDWRYEAPPAAGVQADAGPVKVRNLMVLADAEGQGLLLGSIFTTEAVKLTAVGVSAEQQDGTFGAPTPVALTGDVPINGGLVLGGDDSRVEKAGLQEGLLAKVMMQFSDGTTAAVEAPVLSSDNADYKAAWDKING